MPERHPLRETDDGAILKVFVKPNAKRTELAGYDEWRDRVIFAVKAKAQEGEANKMLIDLMSELLNVRKRSIEIVSGKASREKSVLIRDLNATEVKFSLGIRTIPGIDADQIPTGGEE